MGFNYMEKFLLSDLLLQYSLTKDKIYYEDGHGEKIDSDSKKEAGRSFRKHRGDD